MTFNHRRTERNRCPLPYLAASSNWSGNLSLKQKIGVRATVRSPYFRLDIFMREKISGIYCFINKINGKKYIGQAQDIYDRKKQHKYRAFIKGDSGYRSAFHSALRKYGWDNFDFYILQECKIKDLDRKEEHWIRKLNTLTPNGYNIIVRSNQYRKPKINKKPIKPFKLPKEEINLSLIDEILRTSFEQVAKKYGYTSGNGIKKRLERSGLPFKKEELFEYWKKRTGKPHPIIIAQREKEFKKEAHNQKFAPKKVVQIDISTKEIITSFISTKEAQRKTGINSGHISECARHKRKSAGGYYWEYF